MEAMSTEHDSADVMKRWNEFKSTDLPPLNQLLRESKAPEIDLRTQIHSGRCDTDEE